MRFQGFDEKDFEVFSIEGFEERMTALKSRISPKLQEIGEQVSPLVTELTGEEMYPHVARHARRSVNPPDNTWVAWADNKRGYKKHPHFQVGVWQSHLFIWFAVIDEAENKPSIAKKLDKQKKNIKKIIPAEYAWSDDHTKPEFVIHKDADLAKLLDRLESVKKAEILSGRIISSDDPILQDGERLMKEIEDCFQTVLPLYKWAKSAK